MKKRTILIVDDHMMFRMGLKSVLSKQANWIVVAEAKNFQEAMSAFLRFHPEITILDIRIPGRDGIDVLREILAVDKTARVLMLSSFANEEEVYRALRVGAMGYLLKDVGSEELLGAVDKVLRREQYVPSTLRSLIAGRAATRDLTGREIEILRLIVKGLTNKEIATVLGTSPNTVRNHTIRIFETLEVADRAEATSAALQRGIVIPEG